MILESYLFLINFFDLGHKTGLLYGTLYDLCGAFLKLGCLSPHSL